MESPVTYSSPHLINYFLNDGFKHLFLGHTYFTVIIADDHKIFITTDYTQRPVVDEKEFFRLLKEYKKFNNCHLTFEI